MSATFNYSFTQITVLLRLQLYFKVSKFTYLFCGPNKKKELASGIGTASSFSWRSAIGRGRGLRGISGSSSSSSPGQEEDKRLAY